MPDTNIHAALAGLTLRIEGPITSETVAAVARFLASATGRAVTITINSPGGSAIAGLAIYGQLRAYSGNVAIIVEGIAASAASLIAMGGNTISIHAGSFIMIHEAQAEVAGRASELREQAGTLDKVTQAFREAYVQRTGRTGAEVAAWMSTDTWFSAEEAVDAGLADRVLPEMRIAASADLTLFNNLPPVLRAAIKKETITMPDTNITDPPLAPVKATLPDLKAIVARSGGRLDANFIVAQMEAGATIDAARDAAITAVASAPRAATHVVVMRDEGETTQEARTAYIAARLLGRAPEGPAAMLRGQTLADISASILEQRGQRVSRGASPETIFGMLTTSDLPLLLQDGGRRAMLELYPTLRSGLVGLAEVRALPDFRPTTLIRLAQHQPLDEVPEHGEVKAAYPTEAGEQIKLATYANSFPVTRQALINDDLGGLQLWIGAAAQAAAGRERLLLAGLLTANGGSGPTMTDGLTWFHANRNNVASATTVDATNIAAMVALMRALTDTRGQTIYGIEPGAIVVSPAKEFQARQQAAALATPSSRDDIQPYALDVIVEPALTGNRWWMTPRAGSRRNLTVGYLNGQDTPTIQTFESADILGMNVRCHFDVAAAVQDPIGWVMNPGA